MSGLWCTSCALCREGVADSEPRGLVGGPHVLGLARRPSVGSAVLLSTLNKGQRTVAEGSRHRRSATGSVARVTISPRLRPVQVLGLEAHNLVAFAERGATRWCAADASGQGDVADLLHRQAEDLRDDRHHAR